MVGTSAAGWGGVFEILFFQGRGSGSDCLLPSLFPSPPQLTEPVPGVLVNWCLQCKCPKCFCLVWQDWASSLLGLQGWALKWRQSKQSRSSWGLGILTCYLTLWKSLSLSKSPFSCLGKTWTSPWIDFKNTVMQSSNLSWLG